MSALLLPTQAKVHERPLQTKLGEPVGARPRRPWWAVAFLVWFGFFWPSPATTLNLPPIWRWSNPAPHGADIFDLAYADGFYIEVGDWGQIFTSEDAETWAPRDGHTTATLRAVTFYGDLMVVAGENGTILVAEDPSEFYSVTQSTTDWLVGLAASANQIVAVGDNGAIYVSTNAVTWQRVSVSFTRWLTGVAYGANTFVTVGESGFIATSPNGAAWTVRTSGLTTNLNRVAWVGDHFLAVGDGGKALTSPNGATWQSVSTGATNALYAVAGTTNSQLIAGDYELRLHESANWSNQFATTLSAPAPAWTYYAAVWDGTGYVATGMTGLETESFKTNNATRWYTETNSIRNWLWSVGRLASNYVAVGDHGTILSSPNGLDWDVELTPSAATNSVLLGLGAGTNCFLIVGSAGTVLWGSNTYLWNAVGPRPTTNDLQGVLCDTNRMLVCGGAGTILGSSNGTNWSTRTTPTTAFLSSLEKMPGGYVCVGNQGVILTSPNATNWVRQTSGTTNWLLQVRSLAGMLMAVGQNGTILVSTNGTNWTARTSGTTSWLNAVDYVGGAWFIAGDLGTFLISTDTTNWFDNGSITWKSLYGLVIHEGQLVSVGSEGVIVRSQLVPASSPVQIARYSRTSGQNLFLFTGQPDQQFYLRNTGDFVHWTNSPVLEFYDSTGTMLYLENAITNGPRAQFYRTLNAY